MMRCSLRNLLIHHLLHVKSNLGVTRKPSTFQVHQPMKAQTSLANLTTGNVSFLPTLMPAQAAHPKENFAVGLDTFCCRMLLNMGNLGKKMDETGSAFRAHVHLAPQPDYHSTVLKWQSKNAPPACA